MALTINIDNKQAWIERNQRIEILKASRNLELKEEDDDGLKKMVDVGLYESAMKDNVDTFIDNLRKISSNKQLSVTSISNHVSLAGNSVLHVAAEFGNEGITQLLVDHFPHLITRQNFQGDTALHVAARAGKVNTLKILIEKEEEIMLLRMRNKKGNTALHEAVINGCIDVANHLLSVDPQLAYYRNWEGVRPQENNKEGKSPLYLAAENGTHQTMFDLILLAIAQDGGNSLTRLEGKSPAHAAIEGRNLDVLKQITKKKPELMRAKETGENNALHSASSLGYLEGVKLLKESFSDFALETNEEGLYPIHVACKEGRVAVVEELLGQWPNTMEFVSEKGQNILHIAAKHGEKKVVNYILGNYDLQKLVNERDIDGNTPLHLAVKHSHTLSVYALVKDNKVKKNIVNNEDLTPYDQAKKQLFQLETMSENESSNYKDTNDKSMGDSKGFGEQYFHGLGMTLSVLHFFGRPNKIKPRKYPRIESKPLSKQEIGSRAERLLVAAVLVAGAAFSAACQVPGNGVSGSSDKSNSSLYAFYFVLDAGALTFSVSSILILCWIQLFGVIIAGNVIWLASILLVLAVDFMISAFWTAVAINENQFFLVQYLLIFVVAAVNIYTFVIFSLPLIHPPITNIIITEEGTTLLINYPLFLVYYAIHWSATWHAAAIRKINYLLSH